MTPGHNSDGNLVGFTFQVCMKKLIRVSGGAMGVLLAKWARIAFAKNAQVGRLCGGDRSFFNHTSSIASFLYFRCRRPLPPLLVGAHRRSREAFGFPDLSHANFVRHFVKAFSMLVGIPCAQVRY